MKKLSRLLKKNNLSVGVFGLGESNRGVIEYINKTNPTVSLTVRSDTDLDLGTLKEAKRLFSKKDALSEITEDLLFLSPSVKRSRTEIVAAQKRGVIISSDADMFFALTKKAPICVTGSDGKSTTTYLISKALSNSGIPAVPCGNFGKSLCSVLDTDLFPIAELSSFQLSYIKPISAVSVITNVTPNHLNWHSSFDEYIEAKMNITYGAEKIVFDCDGEAISKRLSDVRVFCKTSIQRSFNQLNQLGGAENYLTYSDNVIYLNGSPFLDVSHAKRKENYNIRNYLLTTATCMSLCAENDIKEAFINFSGLKHRAELFFEQDGIKYVDSSIDSSPERTIKTLYAIEGKKVVIIGGVGKGLPLDRLADLLPSLSLGAVLLGELGLQLSELLKSRLNHYRFTLAYDMTDAVYKAKKMLDGPGTVILSPAATSFDLYKNFKERGDNFKTVVKNLSK